MRDDALPIRRIVFVGLGIATAVAVAIGVVFATLHHRAIPPGGVPVDRPETLGADLPMLQSAPQLDLATYRAEKGRELNQLGWVDAASGVAHVPIDVAMAMLLARAGSASTVGRPVAPPDAAPLPAVSGHAASMPTAVGDTSPPQDAPVPMTPASRAPQ